MTRTHQLEQRLAALLRPGARWVARRDFTRIELGIVALVNAAGAVVCAVLPARMVITRGTAPLFALADNLTPLPARAAWCLAFTAAAIASAACVHRATGVRQAATWLLVFPIGATWVSCIALSLRAGGGVWGLITWPALLATWLVVAARLVQRRS